MKVNGELQKYFIHFGLSSYLTVKSNNTMTQQNSYLFYFWNRDKTSDIKIIFDEN